MIYTKDIMGYQWDLLLKAINLGILLGGCYDFFRMIRIVFAFKRDSNPERADRLPVLLPPSSEGGFFCCRGYGVCAIISP